MMEDRNWRDAKLPQWVKDSIAAELRANQLTAALSWPTEAKPEPLPFRWGDYDRLIGEPRDGMFWSVAHGVEPVHIKANRGQHGQTWKDWAFSDDGEQWHTTVRRGPLFETERDARLYHLWSECEAAAKKLLKLRAKMKGE